MNTSLNSHLVKNFAFSQGFDVCGIARAQRVSKEEEASLRKWLSLNHEADMAYMRNYLDKRLDPRLLLPGALSIISVALNYAPKNMPPADQPQIATYALGKDYHDVMKRKLFALAYDLRLEQDEFKVCVDTAPLLERYWAVRAGLGWRGKNQQLIIPRMGSMFFLGELIVTREADHYDSPCTKHCGNCRKCIDACPTHALAESGENEDFDSRKCLSYLTIENRGDLNKDISQKMGNVIYGCDRCQQVCPFNRDARPNSTPELQPSDDLLAMTRDKWLHLSEDDYRRLFKGSAVKRAKYSGLIRNIQWALGEDSDLPSPQ